MSTFRLQGELQCVAVFNFTAHVLNIIFDTCFLHVLTDTGLETYNLPTLRSVILNEEIVSGIRILQVNLISETNMFCLFLFFFARIRRLRLNTYQSLA